MLEIKLFDSNFISHHNPNSSSRIKNPEFFSWYRDSNKKSISAFYTDIYLKLPEYLETYNKNVLEQYPYFANFTAKDRFRFNYAWLLEPPSIFPQTYDYFFKENGEKYFKKIFTFSKELIAKNSDKFIFCPVSACWIEIPEQKIHKKSKLVSIIASSKNWTDGHLLRHSIIKNYGDIVDVYGYGYNPVEKTSDAIKDYMFTIVVENCKYDYYFSEKLGDCFACGTIPIYWGCPSIDIFFDKNGIITFNELNDLEPILNTLSINLYNSMEKSIVKNFEKIKKYFISEDFMYQNYTSIFKVK